MTVIAQDDHLTAGAWVACEWRRVMEARERITISLVFHGLTYNMLEHYWSRGIFSMQLLSFLREQLTDCIGFERKLRYELL